jgi:predicted nucleotidyltransferase
MRISSEEANFLKKEISALAPDALVYLFGSRVDDGQKGGDIDIMVLSARRLNWKDKSKLRWRYFGKYGEQRMDIVTFSFTDENPFKRLIMEKGMQL